MEQHHLRPEKDIRQHGKRQGPAKPGGQGTWQDAMVEEGSGETLHAHEAGLDDQSEQGPGQDLGQQLGDGAGHGRPAGLQAGRRHFAQGAQKAELQSSGKKGVGKDPESVAIHA